MRSAASGARACAAAAFVLALGRPAPAADRQLELGAENLFYRTAESPLNPGNLLGLRKSEDLLRGTLSWKEARGRARVVFRGYVERRFGAKDETSWVAREAYLQYTFSEAVKVRAGKQRLAWGSGLAWNPTSRLERPKNPLNTGLEQEGALALRADVTPTAWAGLILVAARSETGVGDLPFSVAGEKRTGGAARARFLVKDTDLALVVSGGEHERTLVGLDLGRTVLSRVALHAEAAAWRGAEMPPARVDRTFFRVAAGGLYTVGESSFALEYFFNGEGYDEGERGSWLSAVSAAAAAARDPRLPAPAREEALARYAGLATIPYAGGLGLRRHYGHASWSHGTPGGRWTPAVRAVVGLSDGALALTPGIAYAPRGNVTLGLDAVALFGPAESEYRLAPLRSAVQGRVKVLF